MKILFDTNVLLDVLLDRQPHSQAAAQLVGRVERGELTGMLGATTLTTIHYLVAKATDQDKALDIIRKLLNLFSVAAVDRTVLELAAALGFADYEDAVLHEAGRLGGASAIVTRNLGDFAAGSLLVHAPADLEAMLSLASQAE